jgi:DNA-binding winged helix-turn-helix (wHTH) protein
MLYRFGAFELDDQLFQVRHAGAPVALQPRVFDLLLFLLRKRSVVVTRAELLADVWGGTVVTKDAVAQAVMALRKALGDDGELPRFIETVRARGYRFVAPVTTSATIAPPSSGAGVLTGVGAKLAKLVHHIERGGGVVLVTGEPGVGRTRFVGELGDRVPAAIVVRCAAPGAPHLWLVKEVLRERRSMGSSPTSSPGRSTRPRSRCRRRASRSRTRFATRSCASQRENRS